MKKAIKHSEKNKSAANKNSTKVSNTKQAGYKEEVYNHEKQKAYQKSDAAKNKTENTAGPED